MAKQHVTTTINGEAVEFLCETRQSLLDVLRDELDMTGTKEGCGTGDCGACSVTLDGDLVCSCLVLGVEAEGVVGRIDIAVAQGVFKEIAGKNAGSYFVFGFVIKLLPPLRSTAKVIGRAVKNIAVVLGFQGNLKAIGIRGGLLSAFVAQFVDGVFAPAFP